MCAARLSTFLVLLLVTSSTFAHRQTPQPNVPTPNASQTPSPATNGSGMVWVNTRTGVYHKPGSRYYGKTRQGKYMTEADAIKAGYHPEKK